MVYTITEITEDFEEIAGLYARACSDLYGLLDPSILEEKVFSAQTKTELRELAGNLFFVKEGQIALVADGVTLFFFEEGDLFGLDAHARNLCSLSTDYAAVTERVSLESIFSTDTATKEVFTNYCQINALYSSLLSSFSRASLRSEMDVSPHIVHYDSGSVIVREGELGDNVYTLVEGRAEVTSSGTLVGEISGDEIFGALAAFGEMPRTATVTASEACTVLALPKERFVDLIQLRPQTASKLLEDVARKISSLNAQVVELKSEK